MRKRVSRIGALMLIVAFVAFPQSASRQLDFTAFDKSGQAVTNLTPDDLKLTDNGKPQSILSLRLNHNVVVSRIKPDPNQYSNQTGRDGPRTIILLDYLNGAWWFQNGTFEDAAMAETVLRAIENAEEPDRIYLYILTNRGMVFPVHPIPQSPADQAAEGRWPAQAKHMLDEAIARTYGLTPNDARIPVKVAVATYHAIADLTATAAALHGPTSMVWVTYGFPMHMFVGPGCETLAFKNITLPCESESIDFSPVEELIAGEMVRSRILFSTVDQMQITDPRGTQMLETFAGLTGGEAFRRGEAPQAVTSASAAMRLNYTLVYRPSEANWDGKFHPVRVTCTRQNVEIRAAGGYLAKVPGDTAPKLIALAEADVNDIPAIGLHATASRGKDPRMVHLEIRISTADLFLVPQEGRFSGELVLEVFDSRNRAELVKPKLLELKLTAMHALAAEGAVATDADLQLPEPTERAIRIVVVDRLAGRVGSLTVPVVWKE